MLNFLEPSGPLQACNRTAFFFSSQMFLTLTVTAASAEMSFSELYLQRNYLQSTISQEL